jgi:enoyl-CoA hydratase/carnithine racemase
MPELILAEHRGDVSHVILDRLETRNALNAELVLALGEALRGLG